MQETRGGNEVHSINMIMVNDPEYVVRIYMYEKYRLLDLYEKWKHLTYSVLIDNTTSNKADDRNEI